MKITTLVACSLFLSGIVHCHAAFTLIADASDTFNEPNLVGANPFPNNLNPSILETLYGESNLLRIDDSNDIYFTHTSAVASAKTVAKFVGLARPGFAYFPAGSDQFETLFLTDGDGYVATGQGTFGPSQTGDRFKLASRWGGAVLSSDRANNGASQLDRLITFQIVNNVGHPANSIGSLVLGWDSGTSTFDNDFQDVVFEVSGLRVIPEPSSLLLIAVVTFGILAHRR